MHMTTSRNKWDEKENGRKCDEMEELNIEKSLLTLIPLKMLYYFSWKRKWWERKKNGKNMTKGNSKKIYFL